jgi:transcriptional regulator NrdR family protein
MNATPKAGADRNARGLECPRCGCQHFRVVYTRPGAGGRIVRRRECRYCGRRITTIERANG